MKWPLRSPLAKNTLWMSAGQGLRLIVQAAFFTVIARSLGTGNYGAFVGVAAFVGIASPFGSLGSGNILIRDVARDPQVFRSAWGRALLQTVLFGSFLCAVICLSSKVALPHTISLRMVLLIALSDIIGLNLALLAAYAFQAFEFLSWTSAIYISMSVSRLIAALLLVWLHPHPSALQWTYAYAGSTAALVIFTVLLASARLGRPKFSLRPSKGDLRQGLYFASGASASTIYNDLDKTMLARLGSLDATGIYGAAYRIIEVSFTPVLALLQAAYPNFFRVGVQGIHASLVYAKPLLLRALLFASVTCCALILFAPVIPMVLGAQYVPAITAVRLLSFILPLRSMHSFFSDVLTSTGRQGLRTLIQIAVALVNALLNLWIIPTYSWRGAAYTSIASDGLLAVLAGTAVLISARTSRAPRSVQEVEAVL